VVHVLPAVLQVVFSATHVVPLQWPLQHWPDELHVPLSATHAVWHTLPTQLKEQQSVLSWHEAPAIAHEFALLSHVLPAPHVCEQHWSLPEHDCPNVWQGNDASIVGAPSPELLESVVPPCLLLHDSANTRARPSQYARAIIPPF
jgi:hypothetical protein